jgi:serine/threonine protein kinase
MPKIINNYTLTQLIGEGQYGKVYKAFKKPSSTQKIPKN